MSDDERPVYIRLRDEIAAAILDGRYCDGDVLPSVRMFAAQHGANPLTVAKAYQFFQEDGLILVRRGVGMFVAAGASNRLRKSLRQRFFDHEWPQIQLHMCRLGLSLEDMKLSEAAWGSQLD